MKKFLKISTAMVALVLALACFAACSNGIDDNNANTDTGNKGNGDVAVVKTLSDEWNAIVEGGTLKFSFYTDNTFEYKESVNGKIGEISGTYAIDNARAVAYGKYRLTIEKKSGQFSYATDFTEGGTMSVTISDNSLTVDGINEVFENMYIVEGPWFEVTSFDDLVGNWISRVEEPADDGEYCSDQEFAGKKYSGKWIEEEYGFYELKIAKSNNSFILTGVTKKGAYGRDTFIFSTPLTDTELAEIKAAEECFSEDGDTRESVIVTKEKYVCEEILIKDRPKFGKYDSYTLNLRNGKCYMDIENNHYYGCIKINEAKNGIQIFKNDTYSELLYTAKKQ